MAGEELIEKTKKAYEAWVTGDAETAAVDLADDIEWIIPGNFALSATYKGKDEVLALWRRLGEHFRGLEMQYYLSDGERVVVLAKVELDVGESDQADVLTFRDGKVVKFQAALDTALYEKAWGS